MEARLLLIEDEQNILDYGHVAGHSVRRNGSMKGWRRWLLAGALAAGCLPGTAQASVEVDMLLDKLVEKGVLSRQEAADLRSEMAEHREAANPQLAKGSPPESARDWTWKGDIRLRDEARNRVGTGNDNHRQRIRFRYGFEGRVNDQLKVTGRMATGNTTDPVSTNQSFDTFFTKKTVVLDLANAEYTPEIPGLSKVSLIGGIMEGPLWTVSQLVWDSDLSWDGAAVKLSRELGPATLFSNAGVFSLDTDETEAASLWVIQGGAAIQPFAEAEPEVLKNLKLTTALAYHDYRNTANSAKAGTDPITRAADNTAAAYDFNQLNPSLELASVVGGYPVSLFTDWAHNTSVTGSSSDDGYVFGLKIGKASSPFFSFADGLNLKSGWEAGYYYERIEQDAAFDEFVDSDFGGGGTNRKGHVWWLTLAALKSSTMGFKYSAAGQVKGAKAGENRAQVDWITKF